MQQSNNLEVIVQKTKEAQERIKAEQEREEIRKKEKLLKDFTEIKELIQNKISEISSQGHVKIEWHHLERDVCQLLLMYFQSEKFDAYMNPHKQVGPYKLFISWEKYLK